VRMMTAVLAGVMFLSMAAWAWGELEKVYIPMPRWQLAVDQFTTGGDLAPGQTVTLIKVAEGQTSTLGTGTVESYVKETKRATLMVNHLNLVGDANAVDANRVEVPGSPAGAPPVFLAHVGQARGIPLFPRVYLQAGVGALIMLIGAWLIYWLVGVRPNSVDFLIATDGEMKKVNWSTKKVIRDSTYVVIGYTFLIAGLLALADTLFFKLFQVIGVLG
jgi:preprotein translocase SecE subunit